MGAITSVTDRTDQSASRPARTGPRISQYQRSNPKSGFEISLSRRTAPEANDQRRNGFDGGSEFFESTNAARQRTLEELRTIARAIQIGETDPEKLTDLIFYARHPEMLDAPLDEYVQSLMDEWNSISALLVHPVLNEIGNLIGTEVAPADLNRPSSLPSSFDRTLLRNGGETTDRFDDVIARAVEWCPGLSPAVLKSLLAQESSLNPTVINEYGYAGIAQIGRHEAREAGLLVGIAGTRMDERLNPIKAIPAAARLLNIKAQRLGDSAFSRYGQPSGVDFWKFVLAAYNGGEGTITLAMGTAHRQGLFLARAKGMVGTDAVTFARRYASNWDNLVSGGARSPLASAVSRYFPGLAVTKYAEIGNYPKAIIARTMQAGLTID